MKHINLKNIKAFVFDVDGVLTDGGIFADLNGELYRVYNAKDGFALRMAFMNGFKLGIITGGRSQTIVKRMLTCGLKEENIYLNSRDKLADFMDFCKKNNVKPEEVMFFGDDAPDVPVFKVCGCGICPADACRDAVEAADIMSEYNGGHSFVREEVEKVMRKQGRWILDIEEYKKHYTF